MRLGALVLAISFALVSVPVMAAERGVIIINPDGTITESDAPKATHQAAPEVEAVQPEEKPQPVAAPAPKPKPAKIVKAPVSVKAAPEPKPEPAQEAEPEQDPQAAHTAAKAKLMQHDSDSVFKDVETPEPVAPKPAKMVKPKPAPVKPALVKQEPGKIVKPKKVPAAKAPAPIVEPASPAIKWNKPPKTSKKPVAAQTAPAPVAAPTPEPQPSGPISRDDALRAAIAVAPPFKRSTVLPGNYKGHPVYEVILQTEDGEQSILVDTMTGEIIKAK